MFPNVSDVLELVKVGLRNFRDTNFDLVRFDSLGLALGAGLFIATLLTYKLLWGRVKFSHVFSGHLVPKKYHQGRLVKLFFITPKMLLVGAILFMLVGIANPYLPRTTIEEVVESRERIDLIDVSSSKGWEFENTGKSAGEIGREGFLKFLNMRRGQNDRVSLWVFSTTPYLIEDFIIDDDIYIMEAKDLPYTMVYSGHDSLPENDPYDNAIDIIAPRDRIQIVNGESGTNLNDALAAVIKYFDQRGNRKIRHKSLLIETDAAVEADAQEFLQKLQQRNIKVYLLHMKPNVVGETQYKNLRGLQNAELLKKRVQQFGGKAFDIRDKGSLEGAYREIDKLEKAPISLKRHLFRVFIFQRPLVVAFCLLLLALTIGCIFDAFGESP